MNRFFQIILICFIIFSMLNCTKNRTDLEELKQQFSNGNFTASTEIIKEIKSSGLTENQSKEIEIIEAKIERIQLDFSKNEAQIKAELQGI